MPTIYLNEELCKRTGSINLETTYPQLYKPRIQSIFKQINSLRKKETTYSFNISKN